MGALLAFVALALLCSSSAQAQDRVAVDLELVLAVDTSSSVSASEYDLQMEGLARAFREPAVIGAIRSAGDQGIAVAVVQWAESRNQVLAVPWRLVRDAASGEAFARDIEAAKRQIPGGATGISESIAFSMRQIDGNRFAGLRKVIDISGDGRANHGPPPQAAREAAAAAGVTVNALAILNEIPLLDRYFRDQVIVGSGAFVVVARDWEDFAGAIVKKLIREIAATPVAELPERPYRAGDVRSKNTISQNPPRLSWRRM